jgi:hypothetical protein
VPFNVRRRPQPQLIDIDEFPYEELDYTGDDEGRDSLFHAMGFILTEYGLFKGDAGALRGLSAKAIAELYESGAGRLHQFVGCLPKKYLGV